jgi:hypothetical protein
VEAETSELTLMLPASAGARLAYYVFLDLGVLAPRGWHCFGLYGSSGSTLMVTPEQHGSDDFLRAGTHLTGSAVELSLTYGGTSGRFHVAKIAARIFPVARQLLENVIDEEKGIYGQGFDPSDEFPSGPYPDDQLTRRGDTEVEFVTAGNSEGLGTDSWMAKNVEPIIGAAILAPADMDLVQVNVRLPPEMRDLSPTIVATVKRTRGERLEQSRIEREPISRIPEVMPWVYEGAHR